MAIADSFSRPKAATTLVETLDLDAHIAEDSGNNRWIVDVTQTSTHDSTERTFIRVYIPYSIAGTAVSITPILYAFPGSATAYVIGGATPPDSEGALGNVVDMDAFQTASGDPRVNS